MREKLSDNLKSGRTIIAERERIETASERMDARKKAKHKRIFAVAVVVFIVAILVFAGLIAWQQLRKQYQIPETDNKTTTIEPSTTIIDENGKNQITNRTKEYVVNLEQDMKELGYKMSRVTLPSGKSRELYIDIEGRPYYFKATSMRSSAVVAEDIDRMLRYLDGKGITPSEYVDVRVEEKAYYK